MSATQLVITGEVRITRISEYASEVPLCEEELMDRIKTGHAEHLQVKSNLLVSLGRSVIRALIGGGLNNPSVQFQAVAPVGGWLAGQQFGTASISDLAITSMKFGNAASPPTPLTTDYVFGGSVPSTPFYTANPTVSYPTHHRVRWSGTIPVNVHTGKTVTEEALFTSAGAMFARTTFATPVTLIAGSGIQFDHTFAVSGS